MGPTRDPFAELALDEIERRMRKSMAIEKLAKRLDPDAFMPVPKAPFPDMLRPLAERRFHHAIDMAHYRIWCGRMAARRAAAFAFATELVEVGVGRI